MPQASATLSPGVPTAGTFANSLTNDSRLAIDTTADVLYYYLPNVGVKPLGGGGAAKYQVACSDLATSLTVANDVGFLHNIGAFTLSSVRAALLTASSSGTITITITVNGAALFTTALTIDVSETTSLTAAAPAVLAITSIPDDARIRINITVAGTGAKGLIVSFVGV